MIRRLSLKKSKVYEIPDNCLECRYAEIVEKKPGNKGQTRGTILCSLNCRCYVGLLDVKPRFCQVKSVEK